MYAIGSRQELEALTRQLEANVRVTRALLDDGNGDAVKDMLELQALYLGMLQQAITDHFNGKN